MNEIKSLSIDLETYSDVDLSKCGVYKYTESDNFEILLFAYSINHGDVEVVDLAQGEKLPIEIIKALVDDGITKWAYNASFERVCLSRYLSRYYPEYFISYSINEDTVNEFLNPSSWRCSMIWSAYLGLPLSLAGVGSVLGLEEQKLKEGKDLIKYFCVPCNPTKTNGGRTRNLPEHDVAKWELFKSYNKRDVEVEVSIQERLQSYPVPEFLWDEYHLDQEINDRGIALDMELVENAIKFDEIAKQKALDELQKLTSIENPNSVMQMKEWLNNNGVEMESLGKKQVIEMIKDAPKEIVDVLELRQQISKSSVKKYLAMKNAGCVCNRARGMFQFYGANRTGRWAGRIIQLQNLPQNHIEDLKDARELVKYGDYDAFETLYDVPDTLSQLIRTAFVPRKDMKFIVADFSAIEARVLSFLANEKWRMDVFANNGDIYCQSASAMFNVPVEKHGVNGHLRQKGKIAELACGYGGSVGALKAMGAIEMGLQEEELEPLVRSWRDANPHIVEMWWAVDRAIKNAIRNRVTTETHGLKFVYKSGMLFIELPSGRRLAYVKPKIGINQFGSESVTYEGVGATKKWERLESYGPKFVENIVQAISRDILCYAMQKLSYCFIVGHVHDEMIIECSKEMSLEKVCEQMGETPPWIKGLLLRADGYECEFYKKD
ncbi:MAG: DNA polymerase [Clostridiales bacterium]|nr:DNA polymerase [Clostridiales bacterium]